MNRYIRRVFNAYTLTLATAVLYVPWLGRSYPPWLRPDHLLYGWLWQLPTQEGLFFSLDFRRLLLEILSLTLVMTVAAMALWGEEEKEERPREQAGTPDPGEEEGEEK